MGDKIRGMEIFRYKDNEANTFEDVLVEEKPLTIYLNDNELVTLLCTPDYLAELTVGFLTAEGFIKKREDLSEIEVDKEKGLAYVTSKNENVIAEKSFMKRYITTGCGKGTTFFNAVDAMIIKRPDEGYKISVQEIIGLMRDFQKNSDLFKLTGGVHSAALCTNKESLIVREDIGRHNAIDKIAGRCFLDDIYLNNKIILTSGRISSEVMLKIAKMGVGIIASRSAPTAMAVDFAKELGITVIGFVRGQRFNLYSHPERVYSE
ncbi:Sulfur carrier protein FdhD [Candidatus Syntrophocurvum alkaliphilum]|uniref:Sulfur carrier protein FdhD n=1 Tax=Candidatus Syntrophocurvum alkaliphilum TaxID=2293317 RepID=A0A6I6DLQ4_9FIRM|nr:formate dehydrogenase accessory sulfurtransferase FdhD [Candidatus Syntrophocurvum alkaliphilum]QGU00072.1 Sulfur carrier protein FdhD [Candidatus Syntrophocurvum alkaliphilum]